MAGSGSHTPRPFFAAEQHTPELLHRFLRDLEECDTTDAVWLCLVQLARSLELPFVDYNVASADPTWDHMLFSRTSYDSRWLYDANKDPEMMRWSYFQGHARQHLTPILLGLEFVEENFHLPEPRVALLREAARRGLRSGFAVPLRVHAPPQVGLIAFLGDHCRRDMLAIVKAHGWVLHVAALSAHQRYMAHFAHEFFVRNDISEKQREMLVLVGLGYQDKIIAEKLGISVSALRQRMHTLMSKAGAHNRAEIAALAMSTGLLPDPQRALDPQSGNTLFQMDSNGVGTDDDSAS